ncbi:hypothetical protein E0H39_29625 [Rhizobium leguminosarum bv. viciae]|uniref:hypothetical protein n=1 Tax=Rhizobium leguminosarum TaxID=384 RepID=UPI00103E13DB|nr:hypothetical protein [Rhizobium leguminosarum]TBY57978.1 hypothetical protein E0H39_29625 [Rhizobium leguminosarum bv. viciae]
MLPEEVDILSPEDLLSKVKRVKTPVVIGGKRTEVQAPTLNELCDLIGRHEDILAIIDGIQSSKEDINQDAIVYLLRRAPRALAAFSACAWGRAGNLDVEEGILAAPDEVQYELALAGVAALYREHGTVAGLFTRVLGRMQDLGLGPLSEMLLRILDSSSKTSLSLPSSAKPKKSASRSGRKAA